MPTRTWLPARIRRTCSMVTMDAKSTDAAWIGRPVATLLDGINSARSAVIAIDRRHAVENVGDLGFQHLLLYREPRASHGGLPPALLSANAAVPESPYACSTIAYSGERPCCDGRSTCRHHVRHRGGQRRKRGCPTRTSPTTSPESGTLSGSAPRLDRRDSHRQKFASSTVDCTGVARMASYMQGCTRSTRST